MEPRQLKSGPHTDAESLEGKYSNPARPAITESGRQVKSTRRSKTMVGSGPGNPDSTC